MGSQRVVTEHTWTHTQIKRVVHAATRRSHSFLIWSLVFLSIATFISSKQTILAVQLQSAIVFLLRKMSPIYI